jgi:enoyl-CoA hydratase/carnithine racemase
MTASDPMSAMRRPIAGLTPSHFNWSTATDQRVGVITLNRPARKNALTFDMYAELRDLFRALPYASDIRAIVLTGADGNFCSGGDVYEIIEPLTRMEVPELLAFTRMTGDLVKAMRACPQPIVAAVDGACAGAGAILAMASDLRLATPEARTCIPVHASRARRVRHGSLRNPSTPDRPGTRGRTPVHRTGDGCSRG